MALKPGEGYEVLPSEFGTRQQLLRGWDLERGTPWGGPNRRLCVRSGKSCPHLWGYHFKLYGARAKLGWAAGPAVDSTPQRCSGLHERADARRPGSYGNDFLQTVC